MFELGETEGGRSRGSAVCSARRLRIGVCLAASRIGGMARLDLSSGELWYRVHSPQYLGPNLLRPSSPRGDDTVM